jgi:hypothetical protein
MTELLFTRINPVELDKSKKTVAIFEYNGLTKYKHIYGFMIMLKQYFEKTHNVIFIRI